MREKHHRILAFLIDLLLVSFLTVCICEVSYMNPYLYDYNEAVENYNEIYNEVYDMTTTNENIEEFIDTIIPALYDLEEKSIFLSIWYLIFYYLYFGVFAYFTGGQTLGKKIFKLKVVKQDNNPASFSSMSLRCLLNGSNAFLGVNLIVILKMLALLLGKTMTYFYVFTIVSFLGLIIEVVMLITLLINKDNRSFNDIIFKTKVIRIK